MTCLDVTLEFCEAADALTKFTGLASLVAVRQGDALKTPFNDCVFDMVWAQNAFMNIEDKSGLFRELHRILKPGGKLAFMEVMGGPTGNPVYFPVPWADRPESSFLEPPDDYRKRLEAVIGRSCCGRTWETGSLRWVLSLIRLDNARS